MKTFDHIFLGGGIASLLAARELVKAGHSVALVASPGTIGGHFSPARALGYEFDLGMMLLELDSYQQQTEDYSDYDPNTLGSAGKFAHSITNFLTQTFELREVHQLQVALDDRVIDDYYISNRLNSLAAGFNPKEIERLALELNQCASATQSHPSTKATAPIYDSISYERASKDNHGELIHARLIEPLVRKATNLGSAQLLARYHRLFWAPLYYPETLRENVLKESTLRPTVFHHPLGSGVGALSGMLMAELNGAERCSTFGDLTDLKESQGGWLVNGDLSTKNLSSTLPQAVLAGNLGIELKSPVRSSYLVVFLKLRSDIDCEVLFNAGNCGHFFRLVNQSRLRGDSEPVTFMTMEYNLDLLCEVDPDFITRKGYVNELQAFFEQYGLGEFDLLDSSILELKNKLVFPALDNVATATENSQHMAGIPISLMGPSLGMNGGALNDQIVQALKYAHEHA